MHKFFKNGAWGSITLTCILKFITQSENVKIWEMTASLHNWNKLGALGGAVSNTGKYCIITFIIYFLNYFNLRLPRFLKNWSLRLQNPNHTYIFNFLTQSKNVTSWEMTASLHIWNNVGASPPPQRIYQFFCFLNYSFIRILTVHNKFGSCDTRLFKKIVVKNYINFRIDGSQYNLNTVL